MLTNMVKKFMKGLVKIFFGQSKLHVRYQISKIARISCVYDFSTLYTTLLYSLIKDKLMDLIERILQGKVFFILH